MINVIHTVIKKIPVLAIITLVMERIHLFLLTLITLSVAPVEPFPGGAPSQACTDLRPQHGGTAQTTPSPFELNVDMFRDVEVFDMPATYSYTPSRTYDRK